jgi:predicted nucleic acid-binding protein
LSRPGSASRLYLETSAVLRATLERGVTPEIEADLRSATLVVTSRLSLVESARALHRLRQRAALPEEVLADLEREIESIWSRCHVWELSRSVCDLAQVVAPATALRTLDALHLATYLLARRRLSGLELLTTDDRLRKAAKAVS